MDRVQQEQTEESGGEGAALGQWCVETNHLHLSGEWAECAWLLCVWLCMCDMGQRKTGFISKIGHTIMESSNSIFPPLVLHPNSTFKCHVLKKKKFQSQWVLLTLMSEPFSLWFKATCHIFWIQLLTRLSPQQQMWYDNSIRQDAKYWDKLKVTLKENKRPICSGLFLCYSHNYRRLYS